VIWGAEFLIFGVKFGQIFARISPFWATFARILYLNGLNFFQKFKNKIYKFI